MKILIPLFVIPVIVAVSAAAQGRSVWDGVYTAEQATRGEKLYLAKCTGCHGDTLLGAEGPALAGPLFIANWDGVPLGDLFERIRLSMPLDAPATMSRQETAEVVAHMLSVGKFPAGDTALSTDAGALAQIKLVGSRPQP